MWNFRNSDDLGSQSSRSLLAPSPINALLDMSLLEDISVPRFRDRFLLKMFRHVCWTRFLNTVLSQDSGTHLLNKQVSGTCFLDGGDEKVTTFENRTAITPYEIM